MFWNTISQETTFNSNDMFIEMCLESTCSITSSCSYTIYDTMYVINLLKGK